MADNIEFLIETLDPTRHRRLDFDCGSAPLTKYLQEQARKEMSAKTTVCFVMVPISEPERIAGFYTLSAISISLSKLPPHLSKGLPKYPEVPATLLGRLARDLSFRAQGMGERLLCSALSRAFKASLEVASLTVITEAKDDQAKAFYERFGFRTLDGNRLFLPMTEIPHDLGK